MRGIFYLFWGCIFHTTFTSQSPIEIKPGVFISPPIYYDTPRMLNPEYHRPGYPYITGDTFRSIAKFHIDEMRIPLNPKKIKDGDIIYVKTTLTHYFFEHIRPKFKAHYILITHNDDRPSLMDFQHMLDDKQLIMWFALNVDVKLKHPKLFQLPLGIANRYWPHGNIDDLNNVMDLLPSIPKEKLLYYNFTMRTDGFSDRPEVAQALSNQTFCYKADSKPWKDYLVDLARCKFALSPHGYGLDCHRTWEALTVGCIPIVKTSSLDVLYEDLPVVIVREWQEVTEDFLNAQWQTIQKKSYNKEKVFVNWWIQKIKECQTNFLKRTSLRRRLFSKKIK